MDFKDINFPVYRKYKNSKSYFKIIQPKLFEEIQIIGSKKVIKLTEANQFPEMVFIHDLVINYFEMAEEISEEEYMRVKEG
ncbi:MAG: hypothetical protein Q7W45_13805 [Bacteroidota bacterium]|nr:hypothetical protein [Bacteroidota bacterium]MDP3144403.1 hypothetical protein [Bacteroidota bacterium]